MGRRKARQKSLFVEAERTSSGPLHRFYDALNELLDEAGFDAHVESLCERAFEPSSRGGRPSIPPWVYFRMLLLGYFEGIEFKRSICWRCDESLSLKRFLGRGPHEPTPDHSTPWRMRVFASAHVSGGAPVRDAHPQREGGDAREGGWRGRDLPSTAARKCDPSLS